MECNQPNTLKTIKDSFESIVPYLRRYAEQHKDKYPDNAAIILSGTNLFSTGMSAVGYESIARLFITRTHTSWTDKNRKKMLMSFLMYMEVMTGDKFTDTESMYNNTSDKIIDEFWTIAIVLIPACLDYVYILREPYVDKITGKTKYKAKFPKEGSVLSVISLMKVWNGEETILT